MTDKPEDRTSISMEARVAEAIEGELGDNDIDYSDLAKKITALFDERVDKVLDLLQVDPHQFSKRPCSTCKAISTITGKSFGCIKYAEQHEVNSGKATRKGEG